MRPETLRAQDPSSLCEEGVAVRDRRDGGVLATVVIHETPENHWPWAFTKNVNG